MVEISVTKLVESVRDEIEKTPARITPTDAF